MLEKKQKFSEEIQNIFKTAIKPFYWIKNEKEKEELINSLINEEKWWKSWFKWSKSSSNIVKIDGTTKIKISPFLINVFLKEIEISFKEHIPNEQHTFFDLETNNFLNTEDLYTQKIFNEKRLLKNCNLVDHIFLIFGEIFESLYYDYFSEEPYTNEKLIELTKISLESGYDLQRHYWEEIINSYQSISDKTYQHYTEGSCNDEKCEVCNSEQAFNQFFESSKKLIVKNNLGLIPDNFYIEKKV